MTSKSNKATFAVACPFCKNGRVEVSKRIWVLRGYVSHTRYGTKTLVGCSSCTRKQALREAAINLVGGWWSIPWGLGTPVVLIQNILEVVLPSSPSLLEHVLRSMGVDPEDVKVGPRGFTGEQQRMLDAAYTVLGRAILSDGRVDSAEIRLATRMILGLTRNRVTESEVLEALLLADSSSVALSRLSSEYRNVLLKMACDLVRSDGKLTALELKYLRGIAFQLKLDAKLVEQFLWGTQQRQDPGSSAKNDRLTRALHTLEINNTEDVLAIKAAYRRLILRYHPDKAGPDKSQQSLHHQKAQEINWAYDYLLRYAGAR